MDTVNTKYGVLSAADAVTIERFESGTPMILEDFKRLDHIISNIQHGTTYDKFEIVYNPPTRKDRGLRKITARGPLACNLTVDLADKPNDALIINMLTYFVEDKRSRTFVRRAIPLRNIKSIDGKEVSEYYPLSQKFSPVFWLGNN